MNHSYVLVAGRPTRSLRPADPHQLDRVGVVAGWGRFPWVVADGLRRRGYFVACAGIRDHVDPAISQQCHAFGKSA